MANSVFRFDVHFSDAITVFKKQVGLLVVAGLIALILSAVTFGILAGPLYVGLLLIVKRLIDNDPQVPTAGDLFKGFDYFLPAFLVMLGTGLALGVVRIIPILGQIVFPFLSLAASAVSVWAITLVAYRRLGAVEAFTLVFERIKAGDFWMPLVFALLASLISCVGLVFCIVGVVFTLPFAICLIACGYRDAFGSAA